MFSCLTWLPIVSLFYQGCQLFPCFTEIANCPVFDRNESRFSFYSKSKRGNPVKKGRFTIVVKQKTICKLYVICIYILCYKNLILFQVCLVLLTACLAVVTARRERGYYARYQDEQNQFAEAENQFSNAQNRFSEHTAPNQFSGINLLIARFSVTQSYANSF